MNNKQNQTGNVVNVEEMGGNMQQEEQTMRSAVEREHFDKVAEKRLAKGTSCLIIDPSEFERYRLTKHADYFMKEKMFSLVNQFEGKKLLEVGCGEGESSVRLAYVGKEVTAFDVSPKSIEYAKLVAEANGMNVNFQVGDMIQKGTLGKEEFDIVWFELILHHLVPELDNVMQCAYDALKPGGLFVSTEPVAYARWLKKFAKFRPGWSPDCYTPDECPLRPSEFEIIRRYFPNLQMKYYGLSRAGRFFRDLNVIKFIHRIDHCLLLIPGMKKLAGYVVMWAYK